MVIQSVMYQLYMLPLGSVIRSHSIHHCYADETKLDQYMKPDGADQLVGMSYRNTGLDYLYFPKPEVIVLYPKIFRSIVVDVSFNLHIKQICRIVFLAFMRNLSNEKHYVS